MEKQNLGDRMKAYENCFKTVLPWRMPVIIRLDGKAFHTFTRHTEKPFSHQIITAMDNTASRLMIDIQGAKLAYVQSDEISILLYPWGSYESQPWFGNELQKLVSVSAGIASAMFTEYYGEFAVFDSRAFILPEYEVQNYMVWRQLDWIRNSIQMLAQSLYSSKQLHGKNCNILKQMCIECGHDWDTLSNSLKYGRIIKREPNGNIFIDENIPMFKDDINYLKFNDYS